jgi:hypothetical protein
MVRNWQRRTVHRDDMEKNLDIVKQWTTWWTKICKKRKINEIPVVRCLLSIAWWVELSSRGVAACRAHDNYVYETFYCASNKWASERGHVDTRWLPPQEIWKQSSWQTKPVFVPGSVTGLCTRSNGYILCFVLTMNRSAATFDVPK